jgi:hypothetical protein
MVPRSDKLLSLALSPDDLPHSSKAFTLITTRCDDVFRAIIRQGLLAGLSETILTPSTFPVLINRYAAIAQNVYLFEPALLAGTGVDFAKFLPFVHHRSVFEMFVEFLSNNDKARELQQVMQDGGFVQHLVGAIDDLPTEGGSPHFASSLFRLVSVVNDCDSLRQFLAAPAAMRSVLKEFVGPAKVVLNAQWAAAAAVVDDVNILGEHLSRLFGYLTTAGDTFSPYQVAAIGIIQRLIALETNRVVVIEELPGRFVEIATKFRRHTIAQAAVAEFVVATLQYPDEIGKAFVEAVLPIAVEGLRAGCVEERGFGWYFLRELKKANAEIPCDAIEAAVWEKRERLSRVIDTPYGGELQKTEPAAGASQSQQMLMMLFQILQNQQRPK